MFDLIGKVALVIGGAGGIGCALAVGMVECGVDIIVASRKLERLAKARKALAVTLDVIQERSVGDMVKRIFSSVEQTREEWLYD